MPDFHHYANMSHKLCDILYMMSVMQILISGICYLWQIKFSAWCCHKCFTSGQQQSML